MERLQAAIEKARAQRAEKDAVQAAAAEQVEAVAPAEPPTVEHSLLAKWQALEPIKIRRRGMQRRRIMTVDGGADAAPFDLLRTRLLQQARANDWRRIAIVSPHSACGKTTTTANLAFSLARQTDTRSAIFDFDLRRYGLSQLLRQKLDHGMADVLQGTTPFKDHGLRFGDNVIIGLNGTSAPRASETLQSTKTQEVLREIQETYEPEVMLFDLPPMMATDDNFGFLQNVDAALIVAAAEKTTLSQIDVTERQVAELTNVMGIILNQCRYTSSTYGQDYSYY